MTQTRTCKGKGRKGQWRESMIFLVMVPSSGLKGCLARMLSLGGDGSSSLHTKSGVSDRPRFEWVTRIA